MGHDFLLSLVLRQNNEALKQRNEQIYVAEIEMLRIREVPGSDLDA
jgi:hypothetical protein